MEIKAIAQRIKGLREDLNISAAEMASHCEMTEEEYLKHENGEVDYAFSFLNRCANRFNVDISELLTGRMTSLLHSYAIERKGHGLPVDRRESFQYLHLASRFYNHKIDPLYVYVPFNEEALSKPIPTNTHEGQEFDYVLEGTLNFNIDGKSEILNAGDSIIYNSSSPHGMIAGNKEGCKFLAIVIKKF